MGEGIPEKAGARNSQGEETAKTDGRKDPDAKKDPREILTRERELLQIIDDQLRKMEADRDAFTKVLQMRQDIIDDLYSQLREASAEVATLEEQIKRAAHSDIIALRALDGLTFSQIGKATGYSERQVQRIYKAFVQTFQS